MSATKTTARHGLRAWQVSALEAMRTWDSGPFLISAAPGAGKTRPSIEIANRLLKAKVIDRVAVVCPTTPLTRQWSIAAGRLGLNLVPDAAELVPPRDFHGVAVTYAKIASVCTQWGAQCTGRTLVIADEAHHLGEELAWGEGFALAFRNAARWLLLSGTPFRSDTTPIPGVRYDGEGVAVADVAYTYADAVREGICRPVTFIPYDGTLQWRSGDDIIEAGFDTVLTTREASRRYRTAISAELTDGLPRILAAAHAKLHEARAAGHKDAGGLVVAADSEHARKIAKLLKDVSGKSPTVVLHTETGAHKKLAAFTDSREEWLVAVNMVSEGVDIPRLRVGVYASAAKTPLIFRQVVGRFVRTIAGRPAEMSWLYLPGDPVLRRRESDEELFDERPERAESEKGEVAEFVALSADVAPTSQMSLFGGAPVVAAASPILPSFTAAVSGAEVPDEDEEPVSASRLSAFERRNILRDKRHRLVGDLGRRDRRPHREINAWLNQEVGVTRVEDATLDQLERSISLLLDALAGKTASRR
ncbi:MAG TPA: DEAD/DEAH box helicase family protein [Baekduia sp.]|nr:DEAD/DEAH box helicase family protein [Baekduia sp.]